MEAQSRRTFSPNLKIAVGEAAKILKKFRGMILDRTTDPDKVRTTQTSRARNSTSPQPCTLRR